ncbi:MAG: PglZ domain-containing protein [Prevotellaceae bacterium]|jgi:CheY-like chemotaxis protein|nr:PglZ domain-containing protein [Prevotellaceae bacterium]
MKILWTDDEIDLLRPYLIFLEEKGYEVFPANNGQDAIDLCRQHNFDIIFLDENMPGLSGLETLAQIKAINSAIPVVMITKSEEENIMDMAIGSKIADYLIKPVNPNQILLTLKKHIHKKEIISEQNTTNYRQEFNQISMQINSCGNAADWIAVYKRLLFWELELNASDNELKDLLQMQKTEANTAFAKFVKRNYQEWFESNADENRPMMSPDFFKRKVFPLLDKGEKVFVIVIDNFRYDQWLEIKTMLNDYFVFSEEDAYFSILPTATQYARNAIFSGLMPLQIQQMFPKLWVDEDEEEGKNLYEEALLQTQIDRFRRHDTFSYHKINNSQSGEKLIERLPQLLNNSFNVCVLNFIDMLSHAKTDSKMMRELVQDESAYRSLTSSWFHHSSTRDLFRSLAAHKVKVVLTTDHGTIRVNNAIKVVGDRNTNVNLRYKVGKNLSYNKKEVFEITQPARVGLPNLNVSSTYIFATGNDFFAYPNNHNHYVSYYRNTFQHGGISLEEMIIPSVIMEAKE